MKRALAAFVVLAFAVPAGAQEAKPVMPFNGKDLSGWKLKGDSAKSQWKVGRAVMDEANPSKLIAAPLARESGAPELVNFASGVDIFTEQKFGDVVIEIEFMVP